MQGTSKQNSPSRVNPYDGCSMSSEKNQVVTSVKDETKEINISFKFVQQYFHPTKNNNKKDFKTPMNLTWMSKIMSSFIFSSVQIEMEQPI